MKSQSTPNSIPHKKPWLPLLSHLQKNKKYYYHPEDHQNSLKYDIDSIISSLGQTNFTYTQKQGQLQRHLLQQKIRKSQKKFVKKASEGPSHPLLHCQIKNIKQEFHRYIEKLGPPQVSSQGDHANFIKLSRESQDYLQFYLKNHFKQTDLQVVQCSDKSVILSQLKNNYPCLTENPPEIATRILLGLDINPLNDFHLVPWTSFSHLRRLAFLRQTKSEGRRFLVSYMMAKRNVLTHEQFWAMVGAIIRKLERVINANNAERLAERVRELSQEWLPAELTRNSLQNILTSGSFFLCEELLQLIFIV